MNTGTSQSCTIHATAADGTVFDLQYTYFAGGCNQCPSLTVRSSRPPTDGGDLPDYIGHICRDAGSTDAATD